MNLRNLGNLVILRSKFIKLPNFTKLTIKTTYNYVYS